MKFVVYQCWMQQICGQCLCIVVWGWCGDVGQCGVFGCGDLYGVDLVECWFVVEVDGCCVCIQCVVVGGWQCEQVFECCGWYDVCSVECIVVFQYLFCYVQCLCVVGYLVVCFDCKCCGVWFDYELEQFCLLWLEYNWCVDFDVFECCIWCIEKGVCCGECYFYVVCFWECYVVVDDVIGQYWQFCWIELVFLVECMFVQLIVEQWMFVVLIDEIVVFDGWCELEMVVLLWI